MSNDNGNAGLYVNVERFAAALDLVAPDAEGLDSGKSLAASSIPDTPAPCHCAATARIPPGKGLLRSRQQMRHVCVDGPLRVRLSAPRCLGVRRQLAEGADYRPSQLC